MATATFFLSTGRCGTQWLANSFQEYYSDLVNAEHEPIGENYASRLMLKRGKEPNDLPGPYDTAISSHLGKIENSLISLMAQPKQYIEFGWFNYGAIRYLTKRFKGRVRIVHLVRHPIFTAASLVTHKFIWEDLTNISKAAIVKPTDDGVIFPHFKEKWQSMSHYERCLYFWAEVNALGLEIEKSADVPWLRVRFEDIMNGDGLAELLNFLELPVRQQIFDARSKRVDSVSYATKSRLDPSAIFKFSEFEDIANQLGYTDLDVDKVEVENRYISSR